METLISKFRQFGRTTFVAEMCMRRLEELMYGLKPKTLADIYRLKKANGYIRR